MVSILTIILHDIRPNWDELLKGKEGKLYCMGYLPAPEKLAAGECGFDYDGFLSHFGDFRRSTVLILSKQVPLASFSWKPKKATKLSEPSFAKPT